MTQLKKAILVICILLTLISVAVISIAVETGKITEDAKLRKTTSNNSTVLEIIPKDEEVEILEKSGEWYRVEYQKIKGYVQEGYINVREDISKVENEDAKQDESKLGKIEVDGIVTVKEEVKLLIRPSINSIEVINVPVNEKVTIVQILNDWVCVSFNGVNGWLRKDILNTEVTTSESTKKEEKEENLNKKAYVVSEGINFREEPNTSSKVIRVFVFNSQITILKEEGDWYKVQYKDEVGYVSKQYVSEKKATTSRSSVKRTANETKTEVKSTETTANTEKVTENKEVATTSANTPASSKGKEIAEYAKKYVGYKYVYGGSTPAGFDCSGFTMYVYSKYGISLPHSATSQSKMGKKVEKSNLQPGDLVFFRNYKTNKGIGHVGIYIGNNQFVHASTAKTGVKISSLSSSSYSSRYVTAVRFF